MTNVTIFVRAEHRGDEEYIEKVFGPYFWVQMTYDTLIVAVDDVDDGEEIAGMNEDRTWNFGDDIKYTDFVIFNG